MRSGAGGRREVRPPWSKEAPRVVGHRGAPQAAPENTLAGIRAAAEEGADGVEVDLRRAGDGTVVVIHDADLRRTCGRDGRVADLTGAELFGVGGPTLAQVVAAATGLRLWL